MFFGMDAGAARMIRPQLSVGGSRTIEDGVGRLIRGLCSGYRAARLGALSNDDLF